MKFSIILFPSLLRKAGRCQRDMLQCNCTTIARRRVKLLSLLATSLFVLKNLTMPYYVLQHWVMKMHAHESIRGWWGEREEIPVFFLMMMLLFTHISQPLPDEKHQHGFKQQRKSRGRNQIQAASNRLSLRLRAKKRCKNGEMGFGAFKKSFRQKISQPTIREFYIVKHSCNFKTACWRRGQRLMHDGEIQIVVHGILVETTEFYCWKNVKKIFFSPTKKRSTLPWEPPRISHHQNVSFRS